MTSPAGTGGTALTERARPYTVADLAAMPDDGYRRELIDGQLLVSPAPGWAHQEAAYTLYGLLRAACPPEMRVIGAPFAVHPDSNPSGLTELQPDVLVARYTDLTAKDLPAAPLLAVETLSPSSRLTDPTLKKAAYARMGVPSYWIIDPGRPSLTAYRLERGDYREEATVAGDDAWTAVQPIAVRIVPADLVAGLQP